MLLVCPVAVLPRLHLRTSALLGLISDPVSWHHSDYFSSGILPGLSEFVCSLNCFMFSQRTSDSEEGICLVLCATTLRRNLQIKRILLRLEWNPVPHTLKVDASSRDHPSSHFSHFSALLKFELFIRVVLGTGLFSTNSQVDSVELFILICPMSFCNV